MKRGHMEEVERAFYGGGTLDWFLGPLAFCLLVWVILLILHNMGVLNWTFRARWKRPLRERKMSSVEVKAKRRAYVMSTVAYEITNVMEDLETDGKITKEEKTWFYNRLARSAELTDLLPKKYRQDRPVDENGQPLTPAKLKTSLIARLGGAGNIAALKARYGLSSRRSSNNKLGSFLRSE